MPLTTRKKEILKHLCLNPGSHIQKDHLQTNVNRGYRLTNSGEVHAWMTFETVIGLEMDGYLVRPRTGANIFYPSDKAKDLFMSTDVTQTAAEKRREEEETESLPSTAINEEQISRSQILSFSYDGKKVNLTFITDGLTLEIKNNTTPPQQELVTFMDLLAEDLASECELESTLKDNPVIFYKFTVTEKKGRYGYKMIGKRTLKGARTPMSIVSPLKWNEHADSQQRLDDVTTERLEGLQGEIRKLIANLLQPVVEMTLFGNTTKPGAQLTGSTITTDEVPEYEIVDEEEENNEASEDSNAEVDF